MFLKMYEEALNPSSSDLPKNPATTKNLKDKHKALIDLVMPQVELCHDLVCTKHPARRKDYPVEQDKELLSFPPELLVSIAEFVLPCMNSTTVLSDRTELGMLYDMMSKIQMSCL